MAGISDGKPCAAAPASVTGDARVTCLPSDQSPTPPSPLAQSPTLCALVDRLNTEQIGASWRPLTARIVERHIEDALEQLRSPDGSEIASSDCGVAELLDQIDPADVVVDTAGWPVLTWTTRRGWLHQLRSFLATEEGDCLRRRRHECVEFERFMRIAAAIASFVDSKTGRGCTASYESVAKRAGEGDPRRARSAIRRVYKLLIKIEMMVLITEGRQLSGLERVMAQAHHGGLQFNAGRTVALVSPRVFVERYGNGPVAKRHSMRIRRGGNRRRQSPQLVLESATAVSTAPGSAAVAEEQREHGPEASGAHEAVTCGGTLSPSGDFCSSSSVEEESPSARKRAPGRSSARRRRQASRTAPRPLAQQRLAAAMVHPTTGIFGLRGVFTLPDGLARPGRHIGHVCQLLEDLQLDPTRWTVRDIVRKLDEDAANTGLSAPAATDPLGYLAWRMRRIDWSTPNPSSTTDARTVADRRQRPVVAAVPLEQPVRTRPAPERQELLRTGWSGMSASTVGRAKTTHVPTTSEARRAVLRTSWRQPANRQHAVPDTPPHGPTTTESPCTS